MYQPTGEVTLLGQYSNTVKLTFIIWLIVMNFAEK